jgi:hypothetical protein
MPDLPPLSGQGVSRRSGKASEVELEQKSGSSGVAPRAVTVLVPKGTSFIF